ncbi:MAG TPA: DEAD/DEAH box helicase [Synergistaceae bacterium]|nr:DEAD/DEAH box helicase [Synergistaceae bacterium]
MREAGFSRELHEVLKERYANLAPEERKLLQFAAILTEPVPEEILLRGEELLFPQATPLEKGNSMIARLRHLELLETPPPFEDFLSVPREIREFVTRRALEEKTFLALRDTGESLVPLQSFTPYIGYPREEGWKLFRTLRRALYSKEWKSLEEELSLYESIFSSPPPEGLSGDPLFDICTSPFDGSWLCTHLPANLVFRVLSRKEEDFYFSSDAAPEDALWRTLKEILEKLPQAPETIRHTWHPRFFPLLHGYALFSGDLLLEEETLPPFQEWTFFVHQACHAFFSGKNEESLLFWEKALKEMERGGGGKLFPFPYGSLYVLSLLLREKIALLEKAEEYLRHWRHAASKPSGEAHILTRLLAFRRGFRREAQELEQSFPAFELSAEHPFTQLLFFIALFWISPEHLRNWNEKLAELYRASRERNLFRLAAECAGLLHFSEPRGYEEMAAWGEDFLTSRENPFLQNLMTSKKEWQQVLEALENLEEGEKATPSRKERLVWRIALKSGKSQRPSVLGITPWIQKKLLQKGWSSGVEADPTKLLEKPEKNSFLTSQDISALRMLERETSGGAKKSTSPPGFFRAFAALAGHPLLFSERDPQKHLQLRIAESELRVRRQGEEFLLEVRPFPSKEEKAAGFILKEEHRNSLVLYPLHEKHRKIFRILGDSPTLVIPPEGKEDLLRALKNLSGTMVIQSEIQEEVASEKTEEREGEYRPSLRLLPEAEGLSCEFRVYPLGSEGPGYKPGKGGSLLILPREGKTWRIARNLEKEDRAARNVLSCCTALERGYEEAPWTWHLPAPQDCLELLLQVKECPDIFRVEWPKGETLRITRPLSFEDLSVTITSKDQWFSLSGELRIDENHVLDLKEVLMEMEKHPGQFVSLKNGEFLALTREFRRRIQELCAFAVPKGKEILFHPSASPALHPLFLQAAQKDITPRWNETVERFSKVSRLIPQIPSTFQGKLRDYQEEGFQWLVRMGSLEFGACLADDMGLGKTIQALAVLLYMAGKGPSLVLAPTSVCMNWLREAQRFTPSLSMSFLGEANRQELLSQPGPYEVVLCSYGLLQNEIQSLERIPWNCIVLDEGQAIKNPRTQRSKNVMRLKGNFRLITSGTPLENHLGELWNLFRFLNPGLLGSLKSFNSRFASPIEKEGNPHAAKQLKRLLEPFLLRRTKSQVLEELPPKTEILLSVELSSEESALYEALRRRALEEAQSSSLSPGERRIQILAHIMKLRRACCHPRLILPESGAGSSKLKALEKILWDLEENQHRALVFSQFVDHLSLVRSFLDRRGISYHYLDGNTPLRERKKRVDAFQREEATCFLISLKAGGMGLNLTAADYVVHLDPWWNPAVEDQASDRAHRIGQNRPVTIYRMVAKGTIEEKIVELHRHKRDLAEDILRGKERIPEISMEELLGLLRKE